MNFTVGRTNSALNLEEKEGMRRRRTKMRRKRRRKKRRKRWRKRSRKKRNLAKMWNILFAILEVPSWSLSLAQSWW